MIAIDTNVIVRIVTKDDPAQAVRASRLVETEQVFVSTTVILEAAWVLDYRFGIPLVRIVALLRDFLGLPNVQMEDPDKVSSALALAEAGLDIADAFHLVASSACQGFATFDKKLIKRGGRHASLPIHAP